MSKRRSARLRSGKRGSGKGLKFNFDPETWQFEMKLRLPEILEATGFNEAREVLGKVIQKLTKNTQVKTVVDLYTSKPAPLAKRLTFSLGFLLMFFGEFVLLRAPQLFGLFFAVLAIPLLASRLLLYSLQRNIFYLLEFSTFNTLLLVLNATFLYDNSVLWKVNFMTSNGIILWSILPWGNSLVFSSLDRITSVVVHFLPAVVTYAERHVKPATGMYTYMCPSQMPEVATDRCRLSANEAIFYPIAFSLAWNFAYMFLTEVAFRKQIYSTTGTGFNTSLKYSVENNTIILRQLTRLARKLEFIQPKETLDLEENHNLTVALYTAGNIVLSVFFLSCSLAVFQNQVLHILYLAFFLCALIWNGALHTYPDVDEGRVSHVENEEESVGEESAGEESTGEESAREESTRSIHHED